MRQHIKSIKQTLDDIADDLIKRGEFCKWFKRWLSNDTLGSIDQVCVPSFQLTMIYFYIYTYIKFYNCNHLFNNSYL
jgi:hypothetical protein